MAFEISKSSLPIVEKACSVKKEYVEDFDIIVPDTLPDIGKVVDCESRICLKETPVSNGKIIFSGEIESNILYIPEDEGKLKKINFRTPFSREAEVKAPGSELTALCAALCERSEASVINSRKLSVKTLWSAGADLYEKRELFVTNNIIPDAQKIETLKGSVTVTVPSASAQQTFPISYDVEIPYGQGVISDILKVRANIVEKETKAVTNKVIVKGSVLAGFVYATEGGGSEVAVLESDIPFSQIFDVENAGEDSIADLAFDFSDMRAEAIQDFDGEMRGIRFDGEIRTNIRLFSSANIENVEDAYGVGCMITAQKEVLSSDTLVDDVKSQINLKDAVDLSNLYAPIKNVLSIDVSAEIKSEEIEGANLVLSGAANFDILCVTEWETFDVVKLTHSIPISFSQAVEEKKMPDKAAADVVVAGSSYNINMAGELEVRCVLNVSAKLFKTSEIMTVAEVAAAEQIKSDKKIPAMTAYFVKPGDTLWDIGKHYSVALSSIAGANSLEEDEIPSAGRMLLIPR